MKLFELKAILDRISDEHGDQLEVVTSSPDMDGEGQEPYKLESVDIHLGWVSSDWTKLAADPIDPITDHTVLVILGD